MNGREPGSQTPKAQTLSESLTDIGRDLSSSIEAVIASIPGRPERPMDVAKALGLNKDISSRIVKAVRQPDPLAVLHGMPGPEPLTRLIRAAADLDVDVKVVADARRAVERFDHLIRTEAGDRGTLDAMISAWLPEAREKQELAAKQLAFRGMALIRGVSSETNFSTTFISPSATDPDHVDVAALIGTFGLRRIHPSATVRLGSRLLKQAIRSTRYTLNGKEVTSIADARLDQFCSRPLIELEPLEGEDRVVYTLGPGAVGSSGAANVLLGEYQPAAMLRYKPEGARRGDAQFMARITYPLRRLVFDLLIHEDTFPDARPTAIVHDTISGGVVSIEDEVREIDRLELHEDVIACGYGIERMRFAEIPRYTEMLAHVCDVRGWDPSSFRGYRCLIDYPVVGSQISVLMPRNPGPDSMA